MKGKPAGAVKGDSMSEVQIPEDVFEGRCRWCIHRQLEENKSFDKSMIYRSWYSKENVPCRIYGIARCNDLPGECMSFAPNQIYGICKTCEYNNSFYDGYCTRVEQPNKRQVYIGHKAYTYKADYWQTHELSTCDGYAPSHFWIDTMKRQAAEGKIPRNFDPETMEPVGETERNEAAEKWAKVQAERERREEEKRREYEKKQELEEAARTGQLPGQISMADLL